MAWIIFAVYVVITLPAVVAGTVVLWRGIRTLTDIGYQSIMEPEIENLEDDLEDEEEGTKLDDLLRR